MRNHCILASAILFMVGCVSTQQANKTTASEVAGPAPSVNTIELSSTVGEVGRPFAGKMVHTDNYISDAEYRVSSVPPGLRFDPATGELAGVPTKPGFYQLTLGVRERVAKDQLWPAQDGSDRWFTEQIELAIYRPIE